ncbi:MAG: ABC-type transport auxiliary lipoprotein family protein [Thermodesulfobacteriota bacterium]
MKSRIFYFIVLAALAAAVYGCGAFKSQPEQIKLYTLSYPAPRALKTDFSSAALLEVKPFRAAGPYRSDRMVYAESKYKRSSYVYHKWQTEPAGMVGDLIMRDIRASQVAEAVVSDPDARQTHSLRGNIEAFYEDDSQDPWEAVIEITFTLSENSANSPESRVILHRTYTERKTLEQNNPLGLAEAMSRAVEKVSARMIKDMSKNI